MRQKWQRFICRNLFTGIDNNVYSRTMFTSLSEIFADGNRLTYADFVYLDQTNCSSLFHFTSVTRILRVFIMVGKTGHCPYFFTPHAKDEFCTHVFQTFQITIFLCNVAFEHPNPTPPPPLHTHVLFTAPPLHTRTVYSNTTTHTYCLQQHD